MTTHRMEYLGEMDGYQFFTCPICWRKIAVRFDPYDKVVFNAGDESAEHTGGTGGLEVGAQVVLSGDADWNRLLDEMGFDDLWT